MTSSTIGSIYYVFVGFYKNSLKFILFHYILVTLHFLYLFLYFTSHQVYINTYFIVDTICVAKMADK